MDYPAHFSEEQNKALDDLRKIQFDLKALNFVVKPNEYTILVEISEDKPSKEQWALIEEFNLSHNIFAEFISVSDDTTGVRYYAKFV